MRHPREGQRPSARSTRLSSGGQMLIDALEAQGVDSVFLVPGESFLAALDALYGSARVRTVVCRHEGGAAMMAEATGKLTGRPGIVMATRGPGAVNAASGLYVAREDATPMILLVGLPPTSAEGRAPFQAIDVEAAFSPLAKWAATVRAPERIPEAVARAFQVAMAGRPGPVVLGLPEDVLSGAGHAVVERPAPISAPAPSPGQMRELAALLARARRPMVIVGGPGWSRAVEADIETFAARLDLPVVAAFRAQDYVDNRLSCYVGHAGFAVDAALAAGMREADLLLVVGAELGEVTTAGWTLLRGGGAQTPIHVGPSAESIADGAHLGIVAAPSEFARALQAIEPAARSPSKRPVRRPWSAFRRELRAAYEASLVPLPTPGEVKLAEVVRIVSDTLPEGGIVTNGAGNYAQFVHRYFVYRGYRSGLAPASGSMGYGLPAAIAAKIAEPQRAVVAFAGDGCFQMTGEELATAVQYALPIVIIVANNGMHGTIRMHQERCYPGRVMATSLVNPDFAALARSYGAQGVTIAHTDEFEPAFRHALASSVPSLIELKLDPEALTPTATLAGLRGGGS